jgi:hypothetical protein
MDISYECSMYDVNWVKVPQDNIRWQASLDDGQYGD